MVGAMIPHNSAAYENPLENGVNTAVEERKITLTAADWELMDRYTPSEDPSHSAAVLETAHLCETLRKQVKTLADENAEARSAVLALARAFGVQAAPGEHIIAICYKIAQCAP